MTVTEEPVVRIQGVSKTIGSKTLIDSLTLDIPAGQVYGFLGPNGAGKTTTIRMMVGLMSISKGDIFIQGASIK
ncbi:MAG: ATP-binding cassette domain-containing protein, partial [Paenibacillus macerans]|nr:ATP-binding cassette domain-containing protein [Paenibacillus macerans]